MRGGTGREEANLCFFAGKFPDQQQPCNLHHCSPPDWYCRAERSNVCLIRVRQISSFDGLPTCTDFPNFLFLFSHEFATPFTTNAGQNPGGYSEQVPTKLVQGAVGSLPLLANIAAGLDIVSFLSTLISSSFRSISSFLRTSPSRYLSEDTSLLLSSTRRRVFQLVSPVLSRDQDFSPS